MYIDLSAGPSHIMFALIEEARCSLDDAEKDLAELLLNYIPPILANEQNDICRLLEKHQSFSSEIDALLRELSETVRLLISLMEETRNDS